MSKQKFPTSLGNRKIGNGPSPAKKTFQAPKEREIDETEASSGPVTHEELSQISFVANNQVFEVNLKERGVRKSARKSIGSQERNKLKN